jgi:hypothetical protein
MGVFFNLLHLFRLKEWIRYALFTFEGDCVVDLRVGTRMITWLQLWAMSRLRVTT